MLGAQTGILCKTIEICVIIRVLSRFLKQDFRSYVTKKFN